MDFVSVNLGNILTILSFLIGGIAFAYTIKSDVRITGIRLSAIEVELSELRKVVVSLARQEERMNAMDQRMLAQGGRLDGLSNRVDSLVTRERARGGTSE